jgi:hypothetical protein
VALSIGLIGTGPVQAGLYLPAESPIVSLGNNSQVIGALLAELRGLPAKRDAEHPLQERYKKQVAELEEKQKQGLLSPIDRVNLSGYYLRLLDPRLPDAPALADKVIRVLSAVPSDERDFMMWSNLGTAHQLSASFVPPSEQNRALVQAQMALEEALKVWPTASPYFSTAHLTWYLRAERYHLDLVRLRSLELARQLGGTGRGETRDDRGGRSFGRAPDVTLDALVPGVPCKGPSGEYAPGPVDPKSAQQIPPDASLLVAQVVLWLPFDDRLFWLLGEVANARDGDYNLAFQVLEELYKRPFSYPEVRRHHSVLDQARKIANALYHESKADQFRRAGQEQALASLVPLHGMLPPGVTPLLASGGWCLTVEKLMTDPTPTPLAAAAGSGPAPKPGTDWRQLGMAVLCGVVVGLFLSLQFRQFRRRRTLADDPAAVGVLPR